MRNMEGKAGELSWFSQNVASNEEKIQTMVLNNGKLCLRIFLIRMH